MNGLKFRRPIISLTALAVVGLTTAVGWQQAQAASTVGGFEIDGNIAASTDLDWSNTPAAQPIDSSDHVGNPDSTVYTGGSKEDDPAGWQVTSSGAPPAKDDIGYVYGWAHRVSGHEYAYIGFERASNNGTTQFVVELNQKSDNTNTHSVKVPDRSDGDLRLIINQSGSRSFDVSARVDLYQDGAYKTQTLPPGWVTGQSNTAAIDPIDNQDEVLNKDDQVPAGQFAEVAFDLTNIASLSDSCRSGPFTVLNGRSQASEADTPELKDFLSPIDVHIPSDCATLHITKEGPNGEAATGARFTVSPKLDGTPGSVTVTDGGDATGPNDVADPDGTANGVIDLTGAQPNTDYKVTEVAAPAGYFLSSDNEVSHTPGKGETATFAFTDPLGSVTFSKTDNSDPAKPLSGATFRVLATDGPAADANVDVTVTDNGSGDANSTGGTIKVPNLRIGDYQVTETAPPAGYTKSAAVKTFSIGPSTDAKDVVVDTAFVDTPAPHATPVPPTPTPQTTVLGEKITKPPASTLPMTGQALGRLALEALAMVLAGLMLTLSFSQPRPAAYRRRH